MISLVDCGKKKSFCCIYTEKRLPLYLKIHEEKVNTYTAEQHLVLTWNFNLFDDHDILFDFYSENRKTVKSWVVGAAD